VKLESHRESPQLEDGSLALMDEQDEGHKP